MDELTDSKNAAALACSLANAVAQPFETEGLRFAVGASIGIAVYPRDGETAEGLMDNADTAMQAAKR